jgi:glycine/D-amino acid oxidase-like deaminating enzyme
MHPDVAVIGAGAVGSAIAYGLACRNIRVAVIDGGDRDFRAATANFGLVWQHGKGMDMPAYQELTHRSVDLWPAFGAELSEASGIDLQLEQRGGLAICVGEAEFDDRRATLQRLHNQIAPADADWEMVGRDALERLLPGVALGSGVTGASFGRRDGHLNPLRLLTALQREIMRRGGEFHSGATVRSVTRDGDGFALEFGEQRMRASRVVIAAGLGSRTLARQVGLDIPVRPQRGQILVTERLEPFLPLPSVGVRQTREGTVMIGATHEEVGFDASATPLAAAELSAGAISRFPALAEARLVRQWAGLRIMTPDGHPIYSESQTHPGAFVAQCHSGITLAAIHATLFADAVAAGRLPAFFDDFHQRRFDVPQAA